MKKSFSFLKCAFISAFFMLCLVSFLSCNDSASTQTVSETYYYVLFDLQDNSASSLEMQKVLSGSCVVRPSEPKSTSGLYFEDWFTDENYTEIFDFETPIEKDTVLYAKWRTVPKGSFIVSFLTDCDTKIESQVVKSGSFAEKPETIYKTGYAFSHWYAEGSSVEYDFSASPVTDTVTLNAKWNESGIYEADFEDSSLYCMNLYESLEADSKDGAW